MADNQTLVIGLGRFGRELAETLVELGDEVLGVDADQHVVQDCAEGLTHVVRADGTDADALRQIGAADFERAAVAIGDIQASILTTYDLVDLGVRRSGRRRSPREHGAILERVGATRVVFPERDMGIRVAHTMVGRTVDYIELDEDFVLVETTAPARARRPHAARRRRCARGTTSPSSASSARAGTFSYATPDTRVEPGDLIVVAGHDRRDRRPSRSSTDPAGSGSFADELGDLALVEVGVGLHHVVDAADHLGRRRESRMRSPLRWSRRACSQPIFTMSMVPMSVWSARTTAAPRHGAFQRLREGQHLALQAGDDRLLAQRPLEVRRSRPCAPARTRGPRRRRGSIRPAGKLTVRPAS